MFILKDEVFRLQEKKFFSLCEKYLQGFNCCFEIGRNRNYYLHYFSKENKEKKTHIMKLLL